MQINHFRKRSMSPRNLWVACFSALILGVLGFLPHLNGLGYGIVPILQALIPIFCVMAGVLAIVLFLGQKWISASLVLLGAVLGILPTLVPVSNLPVASDVEPMAVLSINVEHSRADIAVIASLVKDHEIAVLVLTEVDERLIAELLARIDKNGLAFRSPQVSSGDTAGTVILSKYPLISEPRVPALDGIFTFDLPVALIKHPWFGAIRVVGVHPYAPLGENAYGWKKTIESIDLWQLERTQIPMILAGDFNSTYAHPVFRRLAKKFTNTSAVVGIFPKPTWPATGPVPVFAAIDHILIRGLAVTDWQRIKIPNTDHFGILSLVTSIESGGKN